MRRAALSWCGLLWLGSCGGKPIEEFVGVDGKRILAAPDRIEVFRIHREESPGPGAIRGFAVLHQAVPRSVAFARRVADLVLDPDNHAWWGKRCAFSPGVAFRIGRGAESVDVLVCFGCRQWLIATGPEGHATWQHEWDCDPAHAALVALACEAFPEDPALARLRLDSEPRADWLPELLLGEAGVRILGRKPAFAAYRLAGGAPDGVAATRGPHVLAARAGLDARLGEELQRLLCTPQGYELGAVRPVPLAPDVAFRFGSAEEHVDVLVSFATDAWQFVTVAPAQPPWVRTTPFARARPFLVRLALAAFPADPGLTALDPAWLGPDAARIVAAAEHCAAFLLGGDQDAFDRIDGQASRQKFRDSWPDVAAPLARLLFGPHETLASDVASRPFTPEIAFRYEAAGDQVEVLVSLAASAWRVVVHAREQPEFRAMGGCARARPELLALARTLFPRDSVLQEMK